MLSLRKRAWISGGLSALVAVTIGTVLLYSFLNLKVLERFDQSLIERHTRVVAALSNASGAPAQLNSLIPEPAYQTPFSGRYWQIIAPDGRIYSSASLFEATLVHSKDTRTGIIVEDSDGPDGERLRVAHQIITLEDGTRWSVAVAESLSGLDAERAETRKSLILAFALVAALGLGSVLLQTAAILRPLEKLRTDVAQRWERDEALNATDYPEEVAPFVADINALLERNRDIVARSRRQAADLAHALKTPSAIVRNELTTLAESTHDTAKALDALDRLDAQLARSLARIRTTNTGETTLPRTDLSHSIHRFSRLFGAMATQQGKHFHVACDPHLKIRVDAHDIEEVIGNLLDNALKWCNNSVQLTATRTPEGISVTVEDDGPGIPDGDLGEALRSGVRLDTSKPGTGLGLAIATDLLSAYGAPLRLRKSDGLGGLQAHIVLPARLILAG